MPDVREQLGRKVVGQDDALNKIDETLAMYRAGLLPEKRPAGVFLLLGPTGVGKTRTAEAVSESLHHNTDKLIRIHCAEYQEDHYIAKLIGAPPSYVGHDKTSGAITTAKLKDATSAVSDIAVILFDEMEKASDALSKLLLGVFDKGELHLGTNEVVNFEKTIIFMTANLAARALQRKASGGGFLPGVAPVTSGIGAAAAEKFFTPEFMNRVDHVIEYAPLTRESLRVIIEKELFELQKRVVLSLGPKCFGVELEDDACERLLDLAEASKYGARELKRVFQRHITIPLARLMVAEATSPGGYVRVDTKRGNVVLTVCPPDLEKLMKLSVEHAEREP